jgi:hypothetical protein
MAKFPSRPAGIVINGAASRSWGDGWPECQRNKQQVIRLQSGLRIEVRTGIAELVTLLLDECERRGYRLIQHKVGGFVCRQIFTSDGRPTGKPSNHSWGLAVDLNWHLNPFQRELKTNIPPWMVSLMWAYGFFWGGWYNGSKDPMHFEFVKTPDQAELLTRALRQALSRKVVAPAIGDDMFNPYFVQVRGNPTIYIVTSGAVVHVKNMTHLRFLIKGGVPEAITFVTEEEMRQLLEKE